MRYRMLIIGICCVYNGLVAQDTLSFKPKAGMVNVEVNFNPFSSTPVNINYLRFRKFTSDKIAVRIGASLSGRINKPTDTYKESTTLINIRPGFESHFSGTDRLSPYVGFEIDFAKKVSSAESKDPNNTYDIKGGWSLSGAERAFTRVGANMVFGADVYIVKRLYIGTELGLGLTYQTNSRIKFTQGLNTDELTGGNSFAFGPIFNSSLRLGFIF